MSISGYVIYKFNNTYYTFYNKYNSSPRQLGTLLIENIKKIIAENNYEYLKEAIAKIPLTNEETNGKKELDNIFSCVENPEYYCYYTSDIEPTFNLYIEYTYIIDLDDNKFHVKTNELRKCKSKTFNLLKIPNNYCQVLEYNLPAYYKSFKYDGMKPKIMKNKIDTSFD